MSKASRRTRGPSSFFRPRSDQGTTIDQVLQAFSCPANPDGHCIGVACPLFCRADAASPLVGLNGNDTSQRRLRVMCTHANGCEDIGYLSQNIDHWMREIQPSSKVIAAFFQQKHPEQVPAVVAALKGRRERAEQALQFLLEMQDQWQATDPRHPLAWVIRELQSSLRAERNIVSHLTTETTPA